MSCDYTIKPDGSMDIANSQKADKCVYSLWNNQNYYERRFNDYNKYKKEKENE